MSSPPLGSVFKGVYNATDVDMAKLELSAGYLETASGGSQLFSDVSGMSVSISINHSGNDSYDYNPNTKEGVINWDPDKGIAVLDSTGQVVGYESAAANLAHEMAHAADPNFVDNAKIAVPGFDTMAEKVAIDRVNGFITGLGEAPRIAHNGDLVEVPNPTLHSDSGQWKEVNANGTAESSNNWNTFSNNWSGSPFIYDPYEPIGDPNWDNEGYDAYGNYAATNGKVDSAPPPGNLKKLSAGHEESGVEDLANHGHATSRFHVDDVASGRADMHASISRVSSALNGLYAAGLIQAMSSFVSEGGVIGSNFSSQSGPGLHVLYSSNLHHAHA